MGRGVELDGVENIGGWGRWVGGWLGGIAGGGRVGGCVQLAGVYLKKCHGKVVRAFFVASVSKHQQHASVQVQECRCRCMCRCKDLHF